VELVRYKIPLRSVDKPSRYAAITNAEVWSFTSLMSIAAVETARMLIKSNK
jgi:hypothetical protein